MMSGSVEGFGSITWWGFSPAVDLAAVTRRPGELEKGGRAADRDLSVWGRFIGRIRLL